MRTIKTIHMMCDSCMKEHDVQIVEEPGTNLFGDIRVTYPATYYYCDRSDELWADENMAATNDIAMKDEYRKKVHLLTSAEISQIRAKYGTSQTDLSLILGWGAKTITRYETHQIQDKAHDSILKKLNADPKWFLSLLTDARNVLSPKAYEKYKKKATSQLKGLQNDALKEAVYCECADYLQDPDTNGNADFSLDKAVDMIRYFSNHVKNLFKVKLMKLMWYADAVSYKRTDHSISGLVYCALQMGAVPLGYQFLVYLQGINYEESENGTRFNPTESKEYTHLTPEDIEILDAVIEYFGTMPTQDLIDRMHSEQAYIQTQPNEVILFPLTKSLSIS